MVTNVPTWKPANVPPLIHDLPLPALASLLADWGEPAYRARQIWEGLYQHYYASADEFTALPKTLRARRHPGSSPRVWGT